MTSQLDRRDLPWVILIAVSFLFGLAVSWERWGNPLVDCGREMNQPLRLLRGEMLYSEVRHIYGPLSPYVNTGLYKLFGPSLAALYWDGIITAILIIGLIYWIARQVLDRAPAAAATLSVVWLCAFKQAGNYVLPYSYSAIHGCALGLVSLSLMILFVKAATGEGSEKGAMRGRRFLFGAGVAAGLAVLAKTEMGLAAIITGVVAAGLAGYPDLKRSSRAVAVFAAPAITIVVVIYGYIASKVGWHTLSHESFLFLQNLPPELVYFNKRMSGLDRPWLSVMQMISATLRTTGLAVFIWSVGVLIANRRGEAANVPEPLEVTHRSHKDAPLGDAGQARYGQLWLILALSFALFLLIPATGRLQWDQGPYLAMPVLLVLLLIAAMVRYQKQLSNELKAEPHLVPLIVIAVYALASLARVILRVRSGGAYASYLLPASVIVFTYLLYVSSSGHPLAQFFPTERARKLAGNISLGVVFAWVVVTACVMTYRYQNNMTYRIETPRGAMVALPDVGQGFDEAINFVNRETAPTDAIAVMPEGTSLNFLTDRRNPLREEIITPGFLNGDGETRAINEIEQSGARYIFITNRETVEFGAPVFGRDYYPDLMRWIEENFDHHAVLGPVRDPALEIGNSTFFIRVYKRKDGARVSLR
ncbi:MAG TPA: hypothetical protein VJQ56_09855 [Blastocatellia bacterium]|nr:hypothetical protein [Blastocatellia bacterium]